MEIFLSWSGTRSQNIAQALRDWLPKVIQSLKPWISASDIDKGSRWLSEISEKLEKTNFGILCLTPENLNEPWILFEAGALSKALGSSHTCPVLLDFDPSLLKGPLSQFQATRLQKAEMLKLMQSINNALENRLSDSQLEESFEIWWSRLEDTVKSIPPPSTEPRTERADRDILEEILKIVRGIDRQSQPRSKGFADTVLSETFKDALTTLTPKEEKTLRMYLGIGVERRYTEEEIAKELEVPQRVVSEIISIAFRKLWHLNTGVTRGSIRDIVRRVVGTGIDYELK